MWRQLHPGREAIGSWPTVHTVQWAASLSLCKARRGAVQLLRCSTQLLPPDWAPGQWGGKPASGEDMIIERPLLLSPSSLAWLGGEQLPQ